jgi:hypothetical protein
MRLWVMLALLVVTVCGQQPKRWVSYWYIVANTCR